MRPCMALRARAAAAVLGLALAAGCASAPVTEEGVPIRDLAQLAGTYGGFAMTERGRDFGTVRILASGAYEANASATHGGVFGGLITLKDGKAMYSSPSAQQMFGTGQGRIFLHERGGRRVLRWVPNLHGAATETAEIK